MNPIRLMSIRDWNVMYDTYWITQWRCWEKEFSQCDRMMVVRVLKDWESLREWMEWLGWVVGFKWINLYRIQLSKFKFLNSVWLTCEWCLKRQFCCLSHKLYFMFEGSLFVRFLLIFQYCLTFYYPKCLVTFNQ